ncbi:cellulase family glycosylhydrolase [Spirochaetia bacterium 38H-sp]|uniref:mannan endo-1,4-beta-mannosidase n=1 Tax=Rarispira pelagica TaxID=3141764 RepID=A0ABU9UBT0_9SPIR
MKIFLNLSEKKSLYIVGIIFLLSLFVSCSQEVLFSDTESMNIQRAVSFVPSGFVYAEGTNFILDGKPFYVTGANTYDLFTFGDGSNTGSTDLIERLFMDKARIDAHFENLAADGVNVLRIWGFSHEVWHGFEPEKGVYSEPQFMLFDYILDSARRHGVRIIITLENYWEAYGGIDQRLKWEGLPYGSHAARAIFFTNLGCKEQYRNYVRHFVTRVNHYTGIAYKDDPTIFAWELMNEPRYQDVAESVPGEHLRAWVDEMAAFIKALDPNHMVGTGLEGHELKYGFGGDEGNPFVYIHQSPYIDFCSAHPYPTEHWAREQLLSHYGVSDLLTATQLLIKAWVDDAHKVIGKPLLLGEWNSHDTDRLVFWRGVFDAIEQYDVDGSLFWWYTDRLVDPKFGVMAGAPELAVFREHAAYMAAKSEATPVPTTPVPTTPVPTTPVPTTPVPTTPVPTTPVPSHPPYEYITLPMIYDGSGEFFWKTDAFSRTANWGRFINSWNIELLDINGTDYSNLWVAQHTITPNEDGFWYIHFKSSVDWSHLEIK